MQDPNPLPWGALDRFQAHFIVRMDTGDADADFVARTVLETSGRFGRKRVVSARWGGGRLASVLNGDAGLNEMIAGQPVRDARITVEPTDGAVRIHGGWQNRNDLGISREVFGIYDRIAGHVRGLGPPPVQHQ